MAFIDPDNWSSFDWEEYERNWADPAYDHPEYCKDCEHYESAIDDDQYSVGVCLKKTEWDRKSLCWACADDEWNEECR